MMYPSPSMLSEQVRRRVIESLNARLADGLDLHKPHQSRALEHPGTSVPVAPSPSKGDQP